MTLVYVPKVITSEEQLEKLPVNVIMRSRTGSLCETGPIPGTDVLCVWEKGWLTISEAIEYLAPLTAFIPVEAEEQEKSFNIYPRPSDAPWPEGTYLSRDTNCRWYFIGLDGYAHGGDSFHEEVEEWISSQKKRTRLVTEWMEKP